MNLVVLVGNLTRDPEVSYSQNGTAVAKIDIAVNRAFAREGGPDADFFRVTAFGKSAELAERYLSKGRKIGVEGRIENSNYEKDGQKVYRDSIIANRIEFLSPKSGGDQFGGGFGADNEAFGRPAPAQQAPQQPAFSQPQARQSAPAQQAPPAPQQAPPSGFSALEDDEDDLPF